MEEGEVQQYPKIFLGRSEGVFSLSSGGLRWKSLHTDTDKKFGKDDIKSGSWSNVKKESFLRVLTKDDEIYRFDGFRKEDYKLFSDLFAKQFDVKLEIVDPSTSGYNWGDLTVKGNMLVFDVNEKTAIEVPLGSVSQCVLPGNSRNEVEIQFHEDDSADRDEDTMVEMRVYIPPGEDPDISKAEDFQQMIVNRADIRKEVGQSIVELEEDIGTFLTPRGRYAIEMYSSFFRMHGKTYDYKILYHSISRLFLLAKPDKYHVAFVISLEDPIRQGKQVYQHLVMQLVRDEIELPVNLPEDVLKDKYGGALSSTMAGQLPDVVAKVFKALTGKKVFVPGNFRTSNGESAVKCALKASEGLLYPLEKSFLFIHKPTTFIKFEDIDYVEFQRYTGQSSGTSSRNFDLHVQCKTVAGEPGREFSFSAIDRKEYQPLIDFFSTKKNIRIKNLREAEEAVNGVSKDEEYRHDPYKASLEAMGSDEDDESDSDFEDKDEESDEEEEDSDFSAEDESDFEETKKKDKKRKRKDDSEDEGNGKSSKKQSGKKRSKKDPSAPKKASSAFMMFSQEKRPGVVKENPDLSFGEVGKKLGQMWSEISPEEKKIYQDKAEADKKRYAEEMEEYAPGEGKGEKKRKSPKSKKDPNAPKRAMTAYMLFTNSKREELKKSNPNLSMTDTVKELAKMWQSVSPEEKKEWEKKAQDEKKRYEKEKGEYEKSSGKKGASASRSTKKQSSKKKRKEASSEEEEEAVSSEESAESYSGESDSEED